MKDKLSLIKDRAVDLTANLSTSEDEALAYCAARILRYRSPRIKPTITCLYGVWALYAVVGILTYFKYGLVWDLLIFGVMFALIGAVVWVNVLAIKSAQDPRYDWAEEYRDMAEAWRAQRRVERERHLRMGDFYFRRWR